MSGSQGAAVVFTDDSAPTLIRRKYDDAFRPKPIEDVLTKTLGATFYINDKKFEYLRERLFDREGNVDKSREGDRLTFTRFYPEHNVLIDIIAMDDNKSRAKVEMKRDVIISYNRKVLREDEDKKRQLGYLPVFVYQRVSPQTFQAAKAHKVLQLPERTMQEEVLLREKGIVVQSRVS